MVAKKGYLFAFYLIVCLDIFSWLHALIYFRYVYDKYYLQFLPLPGTVGREDFHIKDYVPAFWLWYHSFTTFLLHWSPLEFTASIILFLYGVFFVFNRRNIHHMFILLALVIFSYYWGIYASRKVGLFY